LPAGLFQNFQGIQHKSENSPINKSFSISNIELSKAGKDTDVERSPIDRSPIDRSPVNRSPIIRSPLLDKSLLDRSPLDLGLHERTDPYNGADLFETYRKSASVSRTFDQNGETNKSGGSAFSFSEAAKLKGINFNRAQSLHEPSIKALYNHLEQLPASNFAGEDTTKHDPSLIKKISVKRKTNENIKVEAVQ
jgi:hypothetical protein